MTPARRSRRSPATARAAGAVSRAVAFLRRQQNRDGGFPSQPGRSSNAQSTAWAIQGLDAAGVSPGDAAPRRGDLAAGLPATRWSAPDGAVRYSPGRDPDPGVGDRRGADGDGGQAAAASPRRPPPPAPAQPATSTHTAAAAPTSAPPVRAAATVAGDGGAAKRARAHTARRTRHGRAAIAGRARVANSQKSGAWRARFRQRGRRDRRRWPWRPSVSAELRGEGHRTPPRGAPPGTLHRPHADRSPEGDS